MRGLTAEAVAPHRKRDLATFSGIEAWIFDLDNTLYPRSTDLFRQVDSRIRAYVGRLLNVNEAEAERIQRNYYREHGTTLRGLMLSHDVDPDEFLEFVHDIDHSAVQPDPALGAAILRLPGKKYIFTNGSRLHAERVAGKLGILHHFDGLFDITACNYVPKPKAEAYDAFLKAHGVTGPEAAMFEDLPHNLESPHALGMATVLVRSSYMDHPMQKAMTEWRVLPPHIHHITDDLTGFLEDVLVATTPETETKQSA